MSILWIYDQVIDPHAGGTERVTHLIMTALKGRGHATAGFLVFHQGHPRKVCDPEGNRINDLYAFLNENDVHVVVNQIGYSKWLLEEFLECGGQRWKDEGGRIVTNLHFDPRMFPTTLWDLTRHWNRKTPKQKFRRLGRIALLPLERRKAVRTLREAYAYLIERSDRYIILSKTHLQLVHDISATEHPERIHVIPNPNTFATPFARERLNQKRKRALIVSRLDEPQKRVSLALKAWGRVMRSQEYADWTLQIIGDGCHSDDYRSLVTKKEIANVEFIGRADPEQYYEEASIYFHTAKREGWGLTIVEAMQKGAVPIVMNSSPVFKELIVHGVNGILSKDGSVETFTKHTIDLMRDVEKRDFMASNAIETTKENDLERIINNWICILNDN